MGQLVKQILDNFSTGVITATEGDLIPPTSYVHGYNVELVSKGNGKAVVGTRKCCRMMNVTPVTGVSAIISQHLFKRLTDSLHNHHLLVSDNGRLDSIDVDGNLTAISATAFTASTEQERFVEFADAKTSVS